VWHLQVEQLGGGHQQRQKDDPVTNAVPEDE
jgi:hypothetical protein